MPVWNRESILELLTRELARSSSSKSNLTVILSRIDTVKTSEPRTDAQTVSTATDIARCLNESLRPYDYIGRYSSNEFLILAPESDPANARSLIEKLRNTIAHSSIEFEGWRRPITISLASASSTDFVKLDQSVVLKQLERALDRMQETGGNKAERLSDFTPSNTQTMTRRPRLKTAWLIEGAVLLAMCSLIFLAPSWTCAPNLVSDLFDSGELPPPLPPNCFLTTERPSEEIFQSLERQRENGDLELQQTIVCKMASSPTKRTVNNRDLQWLGSLYANGRLQYRRHVLIAASQDVPGGKLFAVEQCLTPWWKYLSQWGQYCRTQDLPWQ